MPQITQTNKIAVVAVSIFFVSFTAMLVFMGTQDSSPDYLKSDVLKSAMENGVPSSGSHSYFSDGLEDGGGHGEPAGHGSDEGSEMTMKELEDLYRVLINNFSDPVFVLQPKGNVDFVSRDFGELYGYVITEIGGKSFFSYINSEDLPAFVTEYTSVIQNGKSVDRVGPYRFVNEDGTQSVHLVSLLPVVNEETGKVTDVIGSIKDITETIEGFK